MIDVSKIKVDDEVTVRARVVEIDRRDDLEPIRIAGGSWPSRVDILAHHPAPREFKPGDKVHVAKDLAKYEIIAIRSDMAFLWLADQSYARTAPIYDLRHADESDQP